MPRPTYESFVTSELSAAVSRFTVSHGRRPFTEDLAHFAWQRLVEHRELENWLLACERKDLGDEPPWVFEPEDVPIPPPDVPPPVTRAEARRWRGNFLAFPDYEYAFMYPSWDPETQARFRRLYRAAGHTHLPIGVWGAYHGRGHFDFRDDQDGYLTLLKDLRREGLIPVVFTHTDALEGHLPVTRPPFTLDALAEWAGQYLPALRPYVGAFVTGWEFNQIDQTWSGYWTGRGQAHLDWAKELRAIVGQQALIYVHFSPERITGWPDYPDHSGPPDESAWWRAAADTVDGLLYQRYPEESEQLVLAHAIGGEAEDGATDVGDASRIAGNHWGLASLALDFVFFEHSRDLGRWMRLTSAVKDHPLVAGYC